MADMLGVLFGIGVALTLITLLGHGLWLIAAALLRLATPSSDSANSGPRCEHCGKVGGVESGVCKWCGYETLAARYHSLKFALREIRKLQSKGEGDPIVLEHAAQTLIRLQRICACRLLQSSILPFRPSMSRSRHLPRQNRTRMF